MIPPIEWLQQYIDDGVPMCAAMDEARRAGYTFNNPTFRRAYRALGATPQQPTGLRNGSAILDEDQVRAIRKAHGTVLGTVLAKQYGVGKDTIYAIWHRRNWAWLEDD